MKGKRILLGITGGIAAYKIASLIRLLTKSGAEVKCIMTPASCDFISPLVVSALSKNPVGIEFWNKSDGTWNNHVEYGLWADILLIAPATANTISKMANGSCDNLLLATYLSMRSKTLVAPAMDLDMYQHPSTKRNLLQLESDGVLIIPPGAGELASGLSGEGRMAEPEELFACVENFIDLLEFDLNGKSILITAGPTHEAIDPVRFIGNYSSGKMGFALAEKALRAGANVTLISGPVNVQLEHKNLKLVKVQSAQEMYEAVQTHWKNVNWGIFAAAVADFRPAVTAENKIKKGAEDTIKMELVKNPDILAWAGENKNNDQLLIGFALETENLEANGRKKLEKKNLDLIVLNTLQDEGAGFGVDTNRISILDKHNNFETFELKSKKSVAKDILTSIYKFIS